MAGGVEDPDLEFAEVKLVALLKAERREQKSPRGASSHLATGLVGLFPGPGDEVVVDVGLEGVHDPCLVVRRDLDVLVDITAGSMTTHRPDCSEPTT